MGGGDHPAVRAEAQLFDITPAHVGFLDAMSQSEGTAGGYLPQQGSFLELIDTSPLQQGGEKEFK